MGDGIGPKDSVTNTMPQTGGKDLELDDDEDLAFDKTPDAEFVPIDRPNVREEYKDEVSKSYLIYNKRAYFGRDQIKECLLQNERDDYYPTIVAPNDVEAFRPHDYFAKS